MIDDDLEPGLSADERAVLNAVAARLSAERPVPRAAFRGDLGRRLVRKEQRRVSHRRWAFGLASSGAALLAVAALGLISAGPLAPHDAPTSAQTAQTR